MSEEESRKEEAAEEEPVRERRFPWTALALALLLLLVLGAAGSSPFWAPPLARVLPWARKSAVSPARFAALAAGEKAFEARTNRDLGELGSRLDAAEKRLDALAAAAGLSHRNAAQIALLKAELEKSRGVVASGSSAPAPATEAAIARLGKSLAALQEKWAQESTAIAGIDRDVARLNAVTAGLADRLPQLAAKIRARRRSRQNEAVLFLAFLEMRESLDAGRPFPGAYETFAQQASARPRLAAAALPLAAPAREGTASLATLARRLSKLTPASAPAVRPEPSSWTARLVAHLRSLVRIRKVGTTGEARFHEAVAKAAQDLSSAKLESALAAMEPWKSAPTVGAWMSAAEARLRAEKALKKLRGLLIAAGGAASAGSSAAPATSGAKGAAPGKPG